MNIVQFNFNDYFNNPIVKFCHEDLKTRFPDANFTVYTLEELVPTIEKLSSSKFYYDKNMLSYIGDQLRLYLAMQQDDFLYVDADVFLGDTGKILANKNCTDFKIKRGNFPEINNGTFFYTDKDCRFNKYYYDLYQANDKSIWNRCNFMVFYENPFELDVENCKSGDMNLLETDNYHFLLSTYRDFARFYGGTSEVLITLNPKFDRHKTKMPVWYLTGNPDYVFIGNGYFFNSIYKYIPQDKMIELFKEQLQYSVGHSIKFTWVD